MIHVTLNTGDSGFAPSADEVDSALLKRLLPVVRGGTIGGGLDLTIERLRLTEHYGCAGWFIKDARSGEELITGTQCWESFAENAAWADIERLYLQIGDHSPGLLGAAEIPPQPVTVPWLAVIIWPMLERERPDLMASIDDIARGLAWAVISREGPL